MVTFDIDLDVSEFLDILDKVKAREIMREVLEEGAEDILAEAKDNVHVVSGDLRDSGKVEKQGDKATVVFTADYAGIEEEREGGRYPGSHAYLKPAGDKHTPIIMKKIVDRFEEALTE